MFAVTPIVNRYAGKSSRLCVTAVEFARCQQQDSVRGLLRDTGIASARSFTMPLNSLLRAESGAGSQAEDRSDNSNPDEESVLHGEQQYQSSFALSIVSTLFSGSSPYFD